MQKSSLELLIFDDEIDFAEEIQEFLDRKGFAAYITSEYTHAKQIISEHNIDIVFLDIKLAGVSGLDILKKIKEDFSEIEVIMMTGHGDMDTVIMAMRDGAIDFLQKPFSYDSMMIAIERTSKYVFLEQKLKYSKEQISLISKELEKRIDKNFIGQSQAIQEIHDSAIVASNYPDTSVLITGESGTGKEIVARIIHYASDRKDQNFCVVNCAAIPNNLLESEFFGHKKGSFTGAYDNKKGYFEMADGGTLFLDEVAEMSKEMQGKLLRAIEEQKIKRIGDNKDISFNCRIISATNRDIQNEVTKGDFRLDLLHRLQTLLIHIPPLRERTSDIELLVRYFADSYTQKLNKAVPVLNSKVIEALKKYYFPGNVRELKNLVERAMIITTDNTFDCIEKLVKGESAGSKENIIENYNLADKEKILIQEALKVSDYNQTKASNLLGINRLALIRRIKKYNIYSGSSEG